MTWPNCCSTGDTLSRCLGNGAFTAFHVLRHGIWSLAIFAARSPTGSAINFEKSLWLQVRAFHVLWHATEVSGACAIWGLTKVLG